MTDIIFSVSERFSECLAAVAQNRDITVVNFKNNSQKT